MVREIFFFYQIEKNKFIKKTRLLQKKEVTTHFFFFGRIFSIKPKSKENKACMSTFLLHTKKKKVSIQK